MSTLDEQDRDDLADREFAYVKGDERKLPIHDEAHVRNAISRFGQTDFDSADDRAAAARKVTAAAKRHGIDIDQDDEVAKAAGH